MLPTGADLSSSQKGWQQTWPWAIRIPNLLTIVNGLRMCPILTWRQSRSGFFFLAEDVTKNSLCSLGWPLAFFFLFFLEWEWREIESNCTLIPWTHSCLTLYPWSSQSCLNQTVLLPSAMTETYRLIQIMYFLCATEVRLLKRQYL